MAVGDPTLRKRLVNNFRKSGFEFPNIIHKTVVSVTDLDQLTSTGVIISPNCVLGPNIELLEIISI